MPAVKSAKGKRAVKTAIINSRRAIRSNPAKKSENASEGAFAPKPFSVSLLVNVQ